MNKLSKRALLESIFWICWNLLDFLKIFLNFLESLGTFWNLKEILRSSSMKSQGKLGGQNKNPRLSNDRSIANFLMDYKKNT